jgi:hypothetical protein
MCGRTPQYEREQQHTMQNLSDTDRAFLRKIDAEAAEQDAFEALADRGVTDDEARVYAEALSECRSAQGVYLDRLIAEQAQLAVAR